MRVAGSQRLSGKEGLDDFVAASSEHGGDDATLDDDEDDDLQLANVSEDQNIVGLQPQNAHNRQQADFVPSADQPGAEDGKHAAFDVILQGVVQALQKVSGSSLSEIKQYISIQYPGVSKSLLRHDSADTEYTLGRLKAGGHVRILQGPHPHNFPKKRYTPTHRAAQPAPQQVAKIVAWAEKLAVQPGKVQHQQDKDAQWRRKAAEAVVLQCLHELKEGCD
ncbi:hypothetical protein ABBQ38_013109 [Trebouxia sp. C0009 RCD-2024]